MSRQLLYEKVILSSIPFPIGSAFLTSGFSLDALVEQRFNELNTADKLDSKNNALVSDSTTSELEESDVVAMNNYQSSTPIPTSRENGALVKEGNPASNTDQLTRVGEVNGAPSWAESAYHSFWFFAWTLTAVAVAIGTQML